MGSLLNKVTRFANSPEGRRAVSGLRNRGTAAGRGGRAAGGGTAAGGGGGGMLGRLAGGLLGGRRR
jgi:hypothetical protein